MTTFELSQQTPLHKKRTLSEQINDLLGERSMHIFPSHYLQVIIHFEDGGDNGLHLRCLYNIVLIGGNTVHIEAVNTKGGFVDHAYRHVASVDWEKIDLANPN